ncbi:alpha/beta hydrolase family esterase [Sphingomonas sp. Mn802worker]|uniref:alpha/beta hydrolase family esterase n=1 Tax=Sphingomonas sp. Mn802worker TaxID=629773 RepID=UPI001EE6BD44|nr:PHB depolymerase family esterase [Sphingomonas sp. Mn802worker]
MIARLMYALLLGILSIPFAPPVAAAPVCRAGALAALPEHALVHLPATATDEALPLVILLHGSTGTGAQMLRDSGLAATADRHGFVVVAPDGGIAAGHGFVWNIPGVQTVTGAMPPADARDDVTYLTRLIDRLAATGCVDPARVYATGLSGGGRMASWLGCIAARRFAAIAPVVGLRAGRPLAGEPMRPDPATCRPDARMPVLAFSGDADTTNPIAGGGAPYWQYAQAAALQRWATINGCSEPYARVIDIRTYEQGYARCPDGASVAARVVRGGTHSWSVVNNEAMWAFLSRHRR